MTAPVNALAYIEQYLPALDPRSQEVCAALAALMQRAHALGPLIAEAVAKSKPGAMREDAIRRRDHFYAALARCGGAK